jgi:tetratricopeptide (TPR) repeat protein
MAKSNEDKSMVYDMLAQVLIEEGQDFQAAVALLQESESFTPMSNHERLVTLAQLHEAEQALAYYEQGLTIIEQEMAELGDEHEYEDADSMEMRAEMKQVACNIMVSMAELYVTDLCDEETAESECTRLLETAQSLTNTNPEVYRALGNLRMIQGNTEQAVVDSKKAAALLQALIEAGQPIPEFLPRVELANQLMELECWQESTELFVMLLDEDEAIAELWYHAGICSLNWAGQMASQSDLQSEMHDLTTCAVQYFCQAKRILRDAPDEEMNATIEKHLTSLQENGFDVAGAKAEWKKAAYADGEGVDLNEIDSDDEEGDDEMN